MYTVFKAYKCTNYVSFFILTAHEINIAECVYNWLYARAAVCLFIINLYFYEPGGTNLYYAYLLIGLFIY